VRGRGRDIEQERRRGGRKKEAAHRECTVRGQKSRAA